MCTHVGVLSFYRVADAGEVVVQADAAECWESAHRFKLHRVIAWFCEPFSASQNEKARNWCIAISGPTMGRRAIDASGGGFARNQYRFLLARYQCIFGGLARYWYTPLFVANISKKIRQILKILEFFLTFFLLITRVSARRPEAPTLRQYQSEVRGGACCAQVGLRRCVARAPVESARRVNLADLAVTILMASTTVPYCRNGSYSGHLGTLTLRLRIPSPTLGKRAQGLHFIVPVWHTEHVQTCLFALNQVFLSKNR